MTAAAAELARALPGIEIGPELGRGGFGVVWSGRQRRLGREVAIKQLPAAFADDAEIRDRFVTEARVLAGLDHPHIVPVYDYVEQDGLCLLVMECLPGGSVWDVFRKEGLDPGHACVVVIAAAAGLHHAHLNGILHRDVKPENLLLTASRHLKVTDFGIAKVLGGGDVLATSSGDILGTPAYMAPEQATGGDLGPAADVFAAGVMLYELLSGKLPYSQDGGALAIVYRHLHEDPIPLADSAPHIPRPVADVVMRALARDPADRYAGAEDFAVAIAGAARDGFGRDWYSDTGIRVIGSDPMMRTLTSPGIVAAGGGADAGSDRDPRGHVGPRPSPGRQSPETVVQHPDTNPGGLFAAGGDADDRATRQASGLPGSVPPGSVPPGQAHPSGPFDASGLPLRPTPADGVYGAALPAEIVEAEILPAAPRPVTAYSRVRPDEGQHVVGVLSIVGKAEPLVPVRQLLDVPSPPTRSGLAAALLLLALIVVALIGIGASSSGSGTTRGAVTVAGTDVSSGGSVSADLGSPIAVRVADPAGARSVKLALTVHGAQFGSSDTTALSPAGTAMLRVSSVRYLVSGPVDARLELLGADGTVTADRHFALGPSGSGFLTIPGVVLVLALLFALAYLEGHLKPLWTLGRWRPAAAVGLGLSGALTGAVLSGLAWVLGRYQLSLVTAIVCAVLGAAFGVSAGLFATGAGLRRRIRRINRRGPSARSLALR